MNEFYPPEREPFQYLSPFCQGGPSVDLNLFPAGFPICVIPPLTDTAPVPKAPRPPVIPPPPLCPCIPAIPFLDTDVHTEKPVFVPAEEGEPPVGLPPSPFPVQYVGEMTPPVIDPEATPERQQFERTLIRGHISMQQSVIENISEDCCDPNLVGDLALDLELEVPCIGFGIQKGPVTVEVDAGISEPELQLDIIQGEVAQTDPVTWDDPAVPEFAAQPNTEVCSLAFSMRLKLPPTGGGSGTPRVITVSIEQTDCAEHTLQEAVYDGAGNLVKKVGGNVFLGIIVDGAPRLERDIVDLVEVKDAGGATQLMGISDQRKAFMVVTVVVGRGDGNFDVSGTEVSVGAFVSGGRTWPEAVALGQQRKAVISLHEPAIGDVLEITYEGEFCGEWVDDTGAGCAVAGVVVKVTTVLSVGVYKVDVLDDAITQNVVAANKTLYAPTNTRSRIPVGAVFGAMQQANGTYVSMQSLIY